MIPAGQILVELSSTFDPMRKASKDSFAQLFNRARRGIPGPEGIFHGVCYHEICVRGMLSFTVAPAGQVLVELSPTFDVPDDVRLVHRAPPSAAKMKMISLHKSANKRGTGGSAFQAEHAGDFVYTLRHNIVDRPRREHAIPVACRERLPRSNGLEDDKCFTHTICIEHA